MRNLILEKNNQILFEEQLPEAIRNFPNLKILGSGQEVTYLRGILDIPNDNGEIVGSFLVEIKCSKGFPYRFPILFETGGDIPNEADWHKYSDSSCCITVWSDEIANCINGISVSAFIQNFAIPYFANQIHFKQTGKYKNGEYAHGSRGIFQFYEILMKTNDKNLWVAYFKYAFRGERVTCGRNDVCLCGGPDKYKNCHLKVFNTLQQIGEERVLKDFMLFLK